MKTMLVLQVWWRVFVLSDDCTFHYKLAFDGEYNDVANQFTIKWNDPEWNFEWPHNAPILYGRDR